MTIPTPTLVNLYYYLNIDAKKVKHFKTKQVIVPDGFIYSGMSALPVRGAAGFYTKNAEGYKIIDGEKDD